MWGFQSPRRVHSGTGGGAAPKAESDLLVLSFRSHHNAYTEGDGSGAVIERYPCPTSLSFQVIQFIFSLVIVHYLLYWLLMAAVLALLVYCGLWYVSLVLTLLYLASYTDQSQLKTGRAWEWFRQNRLWYLSHQYTELEVVRTQKLDPSRQHIFAVYPHGILIISRIGLYGGTFERLFPGIDTRTLGASPMFWVPGAREICLWMGAVDARKKTAQYILDKTRLSLFIYPGGSKEIFLTNPNSKVTTLIARRGFVRLALEHGCDIVPTMVFREKYMYRVWTPPAAVVSFFLRVFKTPVLLFSGRFFTWLPFHSYMSIVFDAPIAVERRQQPTDDEVEALWLLYRNRIEQLWHRYKAVYGYDDDEQLVIREAKDDDAEAGGAENGHTAAGRAGGRRSKKEQ